MTSTPRPGLAAHRAALAAGACVLAGLLTAPAALAQRPLGTPGPQAAEEALSDAEALLDPEAPAQAPAADPALPAAEPTTVLNQLAAALPQLEGADRRRARALLARPTDGPRDPLADGYPPGAPVASRASANFCVFWIDDAASPDAPPLTDVAPPNGVPDYVDELLAIAEFSRSVEVAPGPLGWEPPKPDAGGCGKDPSARADVYLKNLVTGAQRLFGYEAPDPGQGRNRSQYGYMVLDNDYAEFPEFADPLDAARVTFAHEYNHLLQQNYDSFQDIWMFEATATWVEDHVYPEINDYLNYIAAFARFPSQPITLADPRPGKSLKIYGAAAWNHWLATGGGGYGVDVVRAAWELSDVGNPKDFAPAAYDRAIEAAGGGGFEREFVAFTVATTEWSTGFGNFPDAALYPDMRRKGKLGKGKKRFKLDHTAARYLDVKTRGKRKLKLRVRAPRGLRAGIALVGRRPGASVVAKTKYMPKGRSRSVSISAPGRFERLTAVIVNADARTRGFAGDWIYSRDNQKFVARLKR